MLEILPSCPNSHMLPTAMFFFDMNRSQFFDTGTVTHQASESLWEQEFRPCAIAGPFNDLAAIDLSVLALSAKFPLVAHRAHNLRITSDYLSPFSSQVFPGTISSAHKLVGFLQHKKRNIGVLYSLTESGIQRQEALAVELDDSHYQWMSAGYSLSRNHEKGHGYTEGEENLFRVDDLLEGDNDGEGGHGVLEGREENQQNGHDKHKGESRHVDEHSVFGALSPIKESGYRTVVVSMEFPDGETQLIADAAEELHMNHGHYFWIWNGMFEPALAHSENSNMTELLAGSVLLIPFSDAFLHPKTDPFAAAWYTQGVEAVDRLNAANPIDPWEVGYIFAKDDFSNR